jgi:hypothetical protein
VTSAKGAIEKRSDFGPKCRSLWHCRLLRPGRNRPRRRRAAEQRDELAALHSITSSARARAANSVASLRTRSASPAPQRMSIRRLRPSVQPNCSSAWENAHTS